MCADIYPDELQGMKDAAAHYLTAGTLAPIQNVASQNG